MAIIMNEFLPVPNIAPSSIICNNLSYICVIIFLVDPGHANILWQQQVAYMGVWLLTQQCKIIFLGILMNNNKSPGHMENGFIHFDILPFQNTQNAN